MSIVLVVFLVLLVVALGVALAAVGGALSPPQDAHARVVGRRHDPNERRVHSGLEPVGGTVVVDMGPTWTLDVELMGQRFALRVTQAQYDASPLESWVPVRVRIGPFGPTDVQLRAA